MVTKILVIGEELKDQLTQYMVVERVEVAKLESIGGVQFDKEVGVIILDASVVPLVSETFQRLREQVKVPLLAVVSTYEEAKLALELGCEEIVVKPFNLEELKLRVHKVLGLVGSVRLVVGDIVIDLYSRQVRMGGEEIHLTRLEFDLLVYLAKNAGRVVGYDELLEKVWGYNYDEGNYDLVKTCIKRLRKKIEDKTCKRRYIVAVRGVGYRIEL